MHEMNKTLLTLAIAAGIGTMADTHAAIAARQHEWTYNHALTGVAGQTSEIVSFDARTQTLWVVGIKGIDVLDLHTGGLVQHIDTSLWGEANSIAIHDGLAAVAVQAPVRTDPGSVKLFDTATRALASGVNSIGVGALPDMLTFTPDGTRLLVANEGSIGGSIDPVGSVSIIDMASRSVIATPGFFGVPTYGSAIRSFADMDFEPEYITVAGGKAYVALQEANAMAVLDLGSNGFTRVIGLGTKDFSAPGNAIDPNDRDYLSGSSGPTRIVLRPVDARGLYQPDGIAAYQAGGKTYVVMANEGDAREDEADEVRASFFGVTGDLARLTVSKSDSSATDLVAFGARSFSIRDEDGNLVFDSGSQLDQLAIDAGIYDDGRSDNKGVEPEGVSLLQMAGRTLAFIGLERTLKGALAVYDVTDPNQVSFVDFIVTDGDRAPEGLQAFRHDGR
ncbi:MAG: choice-of-anchor I family protein, partial [Thiobacillaceae bacterium]